MTPGGLLPSSREQPGPQAGSSPTLNKGVNEAEMSDAQTNIAGGTDPELNQAELAHSIIESLLEHTRVVSDLIAVMAQALDQDTTKALTLTAQWQSYLESRRRMELTRKDVERFVEMMKDRDEA